MYCIYRPYKLRLFWYVYNCVWILDIHNGNIVGKHQRSTGMPQIVKSYFLQPVSLKDNLEMLRDILRFHNIPNASTHT